MPPEAKKYLSDIQQSGDLILSFTADKSFADYENDVLLRSGVERQFEIIGEALAQLAKADPELARQVPEHRQIIDFRNILIHGYSDIDNTLVWDAIASALPRLLRIVSRLLED
jgi:uncharacterized protein with HEPN domain